MSRPQFRAAIRTTTFDHEGWIRAQQERQRSELEVLGEGVVEHVVCPPPPKASPPSALLGQARRQTDIVTFCSHIRQDPLLRRAYVTEIQNRKSKRLPYLQEYLLLFFMAGQRRFIARIDYPSRSSDSSSAKEPLLGGLSLDTRQQVTVYRATEDEMAAPWIEGDGRRGSELVAALTTWADLSEGGMTFVSHHLSTARDGSSGRPSLQDVCRLIEGVVLEAPASSSKAHNIFFLRYCFMTARSSLLAIQRCFAHEFACQLGEERELVSGSALEEPAWSCLLRWYLPFASIALLLYTFAVVGVHVWVAYILSSGASKPSLGNRVGVLEAAEKCMSNPSAPECALMESSTAVWRSALRLMLHLVLDLPFPVGLLHTWLSWKELQIVALVRKISGRFLNDGSDVGDDNMLVKTWIGTFARPWFNFTVSIGVGCLVGLALFFGILLGHGIIGLLILVICIGVTANYMLPPLDSGEETPENPEDGLPLLDCEPAPIVPEPPMAGPSSSRL
ncbi:hypothetical protein FRC12_006865 [Ceratobasidium sp. 428]|nr:hypothetical protein FRC12_006865 [Ceratobasidium sp. 428]